MILDDFGRRLIVVLYRDPIIICIISGVLLSLFITLNNFILTLLGGLEPPVLLLELIIVRLITRRRIRTLVNWLNIYWVIHQEQLLLLRIINLTIMRNLHKVLPMWYREEGSCGLLRLKIGGGHWH